METRNSIDITKNVNTTTIKKLEEEPSVIVDKGVGQTKGPKGELKPETETKKKETTPKKRAPKARKAEELVDAPLKGMSDKEKDILINHFKAELTKAKNQIEEFKNNAASAFEQTRQAERNIEAQNAFIEERFRFIDEAAKTFYKSICLATKGDVK